MYSKRKVKDRQEGERPSKKWMDGIKESMNEWHL
jgi:hypothetical protein